MARYIQRIALLGKERWIGWEIDGVGTELPGLTLADRLSEEELRARGVKEFTPLSFEMVLGMNADAGPAKQLLDQDIDFRLDALQVGSVRCSRELGGRSSTSVRSYRAATAGRVSRTGHANVQGTIMKSLGVTILIACVFPVAVVASITLTWI